MNATVNSAPGRALLISLLYFAYALWLAWYQGWQARDIVWSMWVASLVGGYLYILLSIVISCFSSLGRQAGLGIGRALFLLLFFTVHFGGFHWIHGQITQDFFPLAEHELGFAGMLETVATQYWPFVLVALLNLWPQFNNLWQRAGTAPEFSQPYKAVIRNHLMIFLVAFLDQFTASPMLLYPLLILYFFPFAEWLAWRRGTSALRPANMKSQQSTTDRDI